MSSDTETDFSCEQFMATQLQFSVEMMNQINLTTLSENALEVIKTQEPHVTRVYSRSDEASCYDNNSLIAAARDISQRVGITNRLS